MDTANQLATATITAIAALENTTCLEDMTASFEINTIRLNRCRLRAKAAAGACCPRIREDEQRFHVRTPLGRRQHRQLVHDFLARQPHARDRATAPPDETRTPLFTTSSATTQAQSWRRT